MFFISHEYVVIRVTIFFQRFLLIELSAHEDKWLVAIKYLLRRKKENKKCNWKREEKKMI